MKPERGGGTKPLVPLEFALPPCGYKATNTKPREYNKTEKVVEEHRPLKKRPVDESSLRVGGSKALPEPKLITVIKTTPPTILESCTSDDIERQGRMNRNKLLKCSTNPHDLRREALLRSLLKRQLLREEGKAKKHFEHHYRHESNNGAKASLLQRLQDELHHRQQVPHQQRSVSPSQRNPALLRDLLQACTCSSVSSSLVLASNEQPTLYHRNPFASSRPPKASSGHGKIVYDYAHAA